MRTKRTPTLRKVSFFIAVLLTTITGTVQAIEDEVYKKWLKERFADQHEQLIPVVAVADMYFSCQQTLTAKKRYQVKELIMEMSREELALKLQNCLGEHSLDSDVAVDYGIKACFYEQFSQLSEKDRSDRMKLVSKAVASLSLEEKKKSFAKCVTSQTIAYLR